MTVRTLHWSEEYTPTETALRRILAAEGLQPYAWSNGPGDVYGTHLHNYDKVIYVVQGSITFGLPDLKQDLLLHAGDRLELGRNIRHSALVGPDGVLCL